MLVNGIEAELYVITPEGIVKNNQGHIMKQHLTHDGYLRVKLSSGVARGMYRGHRLVAENYLPNESRLPMVNHKDNNRSNNHVDNLEWCDNSHNQLQRFQTHKGTKRKAVEMLSLEGELLEVFDSPIDAELKHGIARQNISKVATGVRKSAGGFMWRYVEGSETIEKAP